MITMMTSQERARRTRLGCYHCDPGPCDICAATAIEAAVVEATKKRDSEWFKSLGGRGDEAVAISVGGAAKEILSQAVAEATKERDAEIERLKRACDIFEDNSENAARSYDEGYEAAKLSYKSSVAQAVAKEREKWMWESVAVLGGGEPHWQCRICKAVDPRRNPRGYTNTEHKPPCPAAIS
jgi:hypothetical protein